MAPMQRIESLKQPRPISVKIESSGLSDHKGKIVPPKRPLVLVAGVARSSFEELAPVLDRHKLTVVQVTSAEDSTKFAHSDRVELVILEAEPTTMSLEDVVRTIRAKSSASRRASRFSWNSRTRAATPRFSAK